MTNGEAPDGQDEGTDMKRDPFYWNAEVIDLEGGGSGAISLQERIESGEITQEDIDRLTERIVADSYRKELEDYWLTQCGDGRGGIATNEGGKIFGGTAGYVKSLRIAGVISGGEKAEDDIRRVVEQRTKQGRRSGDHRANAHGKEGACGCGECDGARAAAEILKANPEAIFGVVSMLLEKIDFDERYPNLERVQSDEQLNAEVAAEYISLLDAGYFDNGAAQVAAIEEAQPGKEGAVEYLEGEHKEVAWVIDLREGTLDREKLVGENAEKGLMVFWEDQNQIEKVLRMDTANADGSPNDELFRRAMIADLSRRVATALNLTKADLRLIILK